MRVRLVLLVLAVILVAGSATVRATSYAVVHSVSPTSGPPGTTVTVNAYGSASGGGYYSGTVTVLMDGVQVCTVAGGGNGTNTGTFVFNGSAGAHTISASCPGYTTGATQTFTGGATVPTQVTGVQCQCNDQGNDVTVFWTAVSGATGYNLYRNGTLLQNLGTAVQADDHTVAQGQTYSYTVSAVNAAGEGPKSTATSATVPSAPTAVTLSGAYSSTVYGNVLNWTGGAGNNGGFTLFMDNSVLQATVTGNTYTDTVSATPGSTHSYYLQCANAAGVVTSNTVTISVAAASNAPTGLTATATSQTSVMLNWSAPTSGTPPTSYTILRIPRTGTTWTSTATTYTDNSCAAGTYYSYEVCSVSAAGASSPATVDVTTPVPDTPPTGAGSGPLVLKGLAVTASGRNVNVTFTPLAAADVQAAVAVGVTHAVACTVPNPPPHFSATYTIYVDGASVTSLGSTPSLPFTVSNLVPGVHSVQVYAFGAYSEYHNVAAAQNGYAGDLWGWDASSWTSPQTVTVGAAGTGVTPFVSRVTGSTASTATLSWPAGTPPNAIGYAFFVDGSEVYESINGYYGGGYAQVDPTTSYTFSGLSNGGDVALRVDALTDGPSGSAWVTGNTIDWVVGTYVDPNGPSTQPSGPSTQPSSDFSASLPGTKWGQVGDSFKAWCPALPALTGDPVSQLSFDVPWVDGDTKTLSIDWSDGTGKTLAAWVQSALKVLFVLGLAWRVVQDVRQY